MRLLTAATIAAFTLFALPAAAQEVRQPGTVMVTGHGEVTGAPDTAFVNSGVTSQAATAREALDANTAAMGELITVLKAAGIEERDIQTSGFSVNPNYVYSQQTDANGYTLPPRINGYVVSNMVTVRVRKLDTLGAVLDRAVTVGANTINGVTFSVADPTDLYDRARTAAFADARRKAGLYAMQAGSTLGRLVSISENQGYGQPQPYPMRAMAEQAPSAPVPVQAGELTFSIDVSVAWSLGE